MHVTPLCGHCKSSFHTSLRLWKKRVELLKWFMFMHAFILKWIIKTALWRHQMETISALLALCAVNSPVTGEFPPQRPVTRSFDVYFDLHLNKRVSKQSWGWWFETPSHSLWRHCNGHGIYDTWFYEALRKWFVLLILFLPALILWDFARNAIAIMKPIRTTAPIDDTKQSRPVVM